MPATDNNPNLSLLKQTREAKGLTLEIVHEATKIPLDALKAIEEGYSLRMMSPFYYRGFIKIYAEFLGLNSQEVQGLYGLSSKVVPAAKTVVKAKTKPNYIGEQLQEWFSLVFTKKNLIRLGKLIALLVALVLVLRLAGCMIDGVKGALKQKPKSAAAVKKEVKEEKKSVKPVVVKEEKAPEEPVAKAIKAESTNRKVSLGVRATKDTWVQVKADGKVVFEMTMKKGTMESWQADKEILLSGKNINELDMEVNGNHLGALGSQQRKARKVSITKEGLTVKK